LVLVATSLASWAPMFSHGSSSSTSLAIVTPSFVIVGGPHFLSSTTLWPLGPSVMATVSASLSTPASRARRASSPNFNSLDAMRMPPYGAALSGETSLADDGEHVTRGKHEVLAAGHLDLGAAVLGVQDLVAHRDVQRDALAVLEPARTHR